MNKPGEIPKLLKQVLGIFLSLGVRFHMVVGDSAFNTLSCKHVLHHVYGDYQGIQFGLAVPDEHETCGIVERFFLSVQRRASANLLAFLVLSTSIRLCYFHLAFQQWHIREK